MVRFSKFLKYNNSILIISIPSETLVKLYSPAVRLEPICVCPNRSILIPGSIIRGSLLSKQENILEVVFVG
jgi:hypothetical protein